MASTSEAGNGKNVANMNVLIASCVANTDRYKPSNKNLEITALESLSVSGEQAIGAVNELFPENKKAIAARKIAFDPLGHLATRVYNAVVSSGVSKEIVSNVLTINRKIQGTRATPKLTPEAKAALKAAGTEKNESSASQQSFDEIIGNFDKMIKLVAALPEYAPNEEDLKVAALQATLTNLKETNKAAVDSEVPLYNARSARKELFNKEGTGLVDISLAVKAYIKSVDGANGRWYKQISGLEFKREK
jgi:hypothetical protein